MQELRKEIDHLEHSLDNEKPIPWWWLVRVVVLIGRAVIGLEYYKRESVESSELLRMKRNARKMGM